MFDKIKDFYHSSDFSIESSSEEYYEEEIEEED